MSENTNNNTTTSAVASVKPYYQRWRLLKDKLARYGIAFGGLAVIVALVLIFLYLVYVVYPLFLSAHADAVAEYALPEAGQGKTLLLAMEEQNEVAVRFSDQGRAIFFRVKNGETLSAEPVGIPGGVAITSFAQGQPAKGVVAYGLADGRALIVRHRYRVTYPGDVRLITPYLEYPLGKTPLVVDEAGSALQHLAVQVDEDQATLVAKTSDKRLLLTRFSREESLFGDEPELEVTHMTIRRTEEDTDFMLLDKEQRMLYLASRNGELRYVDVSGSEPGRFKEKLVDVLPVGTEVSSMVFLNGDLSLLIGDSSGLVSQWTLVRDAQNRFTMQRIRVFKVSGHKILAIRSEQRRKGFLTVDAAGVVGIYHTTAERMLIEKRVGSSRPVAVALSPRANAFVVLDSADKMHYWRVENEHPEVSLQSIWGEVWYESYPRPAYIWQSSSASNDFEPKFSLTPLLFGTLKAAFYAMLVAIPLAIMGAIYTAYFMAPRMRLLVKPSIEIMEALPTVILGFLAGLWLAPFVEENLASIFAMLLVIPVGVMVFAFCWQQLPKRIQYFFPEGWDAALLIPVVMLSGWLAFFISPGLEELFFQGDLRLWFQREWGIGYDQRNALVGGLAMGFAVIPTIFSITEDAIFSVPRHLTVGSLALGATPWQTMIRVVLLTASPGIFSAVMIGFGRAVGETMIVLMATGNTPVMDLSIFQGMRTQSANIAVEMPESEVDSTHYRILFLAALVLFLFTFVFNTLAELIRQRLRNKYSSL